MHSKLLWVLVALAGLVVLASAANDNNTDGIGPLAVPPELLQILLSHQSNWEAAAAAAESPKEASVWSRVLSPFSRMTSYLRQFVCSSTSNTTPSSTTPSSTTPAPSTTCSCGIKGPSRILGGQPASDKEWPWQAFLLIDDQYQCGGSVISENWVVTAAHCLLGRTKVSVSLGIRIVSDPPIHMSEGTITLHPQYNPTTVDNDIALIRLKTPAPLSSSIQPICLPYKYSSTDFAGRTATVIGWGTTSDGGQTSTQLLKVSMPVLNQVQCTTSPYLFTSSRITNNMFCMYSQPGVDACQGDSGGPVNWQDSGKTYLIGVVSFGVGCGRLNYPGVYTKLTNYLNWIDQTAGQSFCNV